MGIPLEHSIHHNLGTGLLPVRPEETFVGVRYELHVHLLFPLGHGRHSSRRTLAESYGRRTCHPVTHGWRSKNVRWYGYRRGTGHSWSTWGRCVSALGLAGKLVHHTIDYLEGEGYYSRDKPERSFTNLRQGIGLALLRTAGSGRTRRWRTHCWRARDRRTCRRHAHGRRTIGRATPLRGAHGASSQYCRAPHGYQSHGHHYNPCQISSIHITLLTSTKCGHVRKPTATRGNRYGILSPEWKHVNKVRLTLSTSKNPQAFRVSKTWRTDWQNFGTRSGTYGCLFASEAVPQNQSKIRMPAGRQRYGTFAPRCRR